MRRCHEQPEIDLRSAERSGSHCKPSAGVGVVASSRDRKIRSWDGRYARLPSARPGRWSEAKNGRIIRPRANMSGCNDYLMKPRNIECSTSLKHSLIELITQTEELSKMRDIHALCYVKDAALILYKTANVSYGPINAAESSTTFGHFPLPPNYQRRPSPAESYLCSVSRLPPPHDTPCCPHCPLHSKPLPSLALHPRLCPH